MNMNKHKFEVKYHEIEKSLYSLPKYQVPQKVIWELKNKIDECLHELITEIQDIVKGKTSN